MLHIVALTAYLAFVECRVMPHARRSVIWDDGIKDAILVNHIIEEISGGSLTLCSIRCSWSSKCKSFNVIGQECELNDADRWSHPDDLVISTGNSYSGMRSESMPSCTVVGRQQAAPFPSLCSVGEKLADGVWSEWGDWGVWGHETPRSLYTQRTRSCHGPFHGGDLCFGNRTEVKWRRIASQLRIASATSTLEHSNGWSSIKAYDGGCGSNRGFTAGHHTYRQYGPDDHSWLRLNLEGKALADNVKVQTRHDGAAHEAGYTDIFVCRLEDDCVFCGTTEVPTGPRQWLEVDCRGAMGTQVYMYRNYPSPATWHQKLLGLCEVQVTGTLLASGIVEFLSSEASSEFDSNWPATNAHDNDSSTCYLNGPSQDGVNWLRLNLIQHTSIDRVLIQSRSDGDYGAQIVGLQVSACQTEDDCTVCGTSTGSGTPRRGSWLAVSCHSNEAASILIEDSATIGLCEVQVFRQFFS